MTLKEQLKEALQLTESDFDNWCSDLYIRYSPVVIDWLKENYEWFKNVKVFWSDNYHERWIDVPFAFTEYRK